MSPGQAASQVLQRVRRASEILGHKVQEDVAKDAKGNALKVLVIHHGTHRIVAFDAKKYAVLMYPMDIAPEDAALLAKQPEETQTRLLTILKREMLEGRSGFGLIFDEKKKPPELRQIRVEQRVLVEDGRPETVQRFADAIQEIVVVAVRCQIVLGQAFSEVRAVEKFQTSASDYHEGMYL